MFSTFDQENLTTTHRTAAASKPLNQSLRALQPRTPAANLKTPFRSRNDENVTIQTSKAAKNTFVTPAPAPRTARAPLGAKTTNAKAHAFQTPAPVPQTKKLQSEESAVKASSTRRSIKKKVYVEPEQITQPAETEVEAEQHDEPDSGYAPPPIIPLPDPPIDFDYDTTYPDLRPENFHRGLGEMYFQSPKDENGFSISLKKQEETHKRSLQDDLDKILQEPTTHLSVSKPVQESKLNTLKARSAASALSKPSPVRTHLKLPSAATRDTAASKLKQTRKPRFAVSRDESTLTTCPLSTSRHPIQVSKATIGFPKAKKAPSILPEADNIFHLDLDEELADDLDERLAVRFNGDMRSNDEFEFRLEDL